jgi:hypothetical protein
MTDLPRHEVTRRRLLARAGLLLHGLRGGRVVEPDVWQSVFQNNLNWVMAGGLGALVGAVWNYTMASFFAWRERPGLR